MNLSRKASYILIAIAATWVFAKTNAAPAPVVRSVAMVFDSGAMAYSSAMAYSGTMAPAQRASMTIGIRG